MKLSENTFKNFLFIEMPLLSESHIGVPTKAENFRKAPKPNFDFYVTGFICTNFKAFTTFSAIFTRIRRTIIVCLYLNQAIFSLLRVRFFSSAAGQFVFPYYLSFDQALTVQCFPTLHSYFALMGIATIS